MTLTNKQIEAKVTAYRKRLYEERKINQSVEVDLDKLAEKNARKIRKLLTKKQFDATAEMSDAQQLRYWHTIPKVRKYIGSWNKSYQLRVSEKFIETFAVWEI
jgi:hypothetical protein